MRAYPVEPIGVVRSSRAEPVDDDWDAVEATVELDAARFGPEALVGLEAFSHVEGVSVCELLAVEGLRVRVRALDAVDGTPVLDVKPVMAEFLPRGDVRQPPWSRELMSGYWRTDGHGT